MSNTETQPELDLDTPKTPHPLILTGDGADGVIEHTSLAETNGQASLQFADTESLPLFA